ncbi:MAG: hypothetical protein ACLR23_00775 [Clostridia bacterium]
MNTDIPTTAVSSILSTDTLIERVPVYNDCACTEKIGYADIVADDRFNTPYPMIRPTTPCLLSISSVSLPDYIIAPGDVDESLGSVSYREWTADR